MCDDDDDDDEHGKENKWNVIVFACCCLLDEGADAVRCLLLLSIVKTVTRERKESFPHFPFYKRLFCP